MNRSSLTDVDDALAEFVDLAAETFATSRYAVMAEELASRCAGLATLVAGLPAGATRADLAFLRRRSDSAARAAETACAASAGLSTSLGEAVSVHAGLGRQSERERSARRVSRARAQAAKAFHSARLDTCRAARLASGYAVLHGLSDGAEPLWRDATNLLARIPIDEEAGEEVLVTLTGEAADRLAVAGVVAHVAMNAPALLVAETSDRPGRYVQLLVDTDGGVLVESTGDAFLDPGDAISGAESRALLERGFAPPDDDHVNWHRTEQHVSVSTLTTLVLAGVTEVHGACPGDEVTLTLALAAHHPDNEDELDDPAVLDLIQPSVPAFAQALAARLRESIDVLGVDNIWATVEQRGWPYSAHLGSNMDSSLFAEVTGNFHIENDHRLDEEELAQLRALGWDEPIDNESDDPEIQPRNHTRVWPAPLDLDTACWHVALTLLVIYGIDLDEPIFFEVGLFG